MPWESACDMPTPSLQITIRPSCASFRHGGLNAADTPLKIRIKLIEPSAKSHTAGGSPTCTHFGRRFKKAYGTLPSEYRVIARRAGRGGQFRTRGIARQ